MRLKDVFYQNLIKSRYVATSIVVIRFFVSTSLSNIIDMQDLLSHYFGEHLGLLYAF